MQHGYEEAIVCVREIRREELLVEIIPAKGRKLPRIRMNGIEYECVFGEEYPRSVTKISLRTDWGKYIVHSHPMPRQSEADGSISLMFNTFITIKDKHIKVGKKLGFSEVENLSIGDEIRFMAEIPGVDPDSEPYAWQKDCSISDGVYYLPAYYDTDWAGRFRGYGRLFKPELWLLFLGAFVGHTDDEIRGQEHEYFRNRIKALREIALQSPFVRRSDGSVSNGWMYFPRVRPTAGEWLAPKLKHVRFASQIDEQNWDRFLEVVIGMTFDGVRDMKRIRRMVRGKKSESEPSAPLPPGSCVDASFFDSAVGTMTFGERIVFTGMKNGTVVHLVDKPEYGVGAYVFLEEQDAINWAEGRLDAAEARQRGEFIPHTEGWSSRLRSAIDRLCGV